MKNYLLHLWKEWKKPLYCRALCKRFQPWQNPSSILLPTVICRLTSSVEPCFPVLMITFPHSSFQSEPQPAASSQHLFAFYCSGLATEVSSLQSWWIIAWCHLVYSPSCRKTIMRREVFRSCLALLLEGRLSNDFLKHSGGSKGIQNWNWRLGCLTFKLSQWVDILTSIVFSSVYGIGDWMEAVQSEVFKRTDFIQQSMVFFSCFPPTIPWFIGT